jgi:sulfofructose kinase
MDGENKHFDILGLGAVAIDDLIYVESYPSADVKVQVLRRQRHCGGLTGTALVTAARLGCNCAYAGVLGYDELSEFIVGRLEQEGINLSHLVRRDQARPIYSTIIVAEDQKTRNIFFDLNAVVGADKELPEADTVRNARVLFVDNLGVEGMVRAARVAHEAGVAVIADFENNKSPDFPELLGLVDHLIISCDFATRITGETNPALAVRKLWAHEREVVIVTCGADGCWYLGESRQDSPIHQPAFSVEVVDTTGCGDVFHGAYAAALVRGLNLPERVCFASAAAALKATQPGGQAGIPSRTAVEAFMKGGTSNEF